MGHVVYRTGPNSFDKVALPASAVAPAELAESMLAAGRLPFAPGTPYIVLDDQHPAASYPAQLISVDDAFTTVSVITIASAANVDDIVAERERRLALGFDYDFGDARGVHQIGTTEADMKGWEEVDKAASALIALGMGSQTINIVTDTGPTIVTALEWKQIILAATLHRQPIWAASFALQAMTPIPADFAADSYWG